VVPQDGEYQAVLESFSVGKPVINMAAVSDIEHLVVAITEDRTPLHAAGAVMLAPSLPYATEGSQGSAAASAGKQAPLTSTNTRSPVVTPAAAHLDGKHQASMIDNPAATAPDSSNVAALLPASHSSHTASSVASASGDASGSVSEGVRTPSKAIQSPQIASPRTRAAVATPTAGNSPDPSDSQSGSVFINGKRRSARAGNSYNADGISAADEPVMDKAMRRTAAKNLNPQATPCKSTGISSPAGTPPLLFGKLSEEICSNKLKSIGISLGGSSTVVNFSFNALKRIEIDRSSVQQHRSGADRVKRDENPFDTSDEKEAFQDDALLTHLVKDLTDTDFDDSELITKICDLKVSGRKSKFSIKKDKARKRAHKRYNSVSP